MKIRQGFVSNSSSTSFVFCFKGNGIKSLIDLILHKYSSEFRRSYDEWHCNERDVAGAIESCVDTKRASLVSIDKVIEGNKSNLEDTMNYIKEEDKDKKAHGHTSWLLEHKQREEEVIKKLEAIREKGLTTVLIIGFGDNHGEVQGGNLGYAMDYDGREIDIDEKDLVVFTEQNR